jgi:hypothetical protein
MQNKKERVLKLHVVRISGRAKWRIKLEHVFIRLSNFVARLLETMMGVTADMNFDP